MRCSVLRISMLLTALAALTGCELLQNGQAITSQPEDNSCVFIGSVIPTYSAECRPSYWIDLWEESAQLSWRERKASVAELDNSAVSQLTRFIVSQPLDTPYQDRLRAQANFNQIASTLTPAFHQTLKFIAYKPSQQLLEYESAITILSEVNSRQATQLKEQAQLLLENEEKVNQLLNIEASILEKNVER